MTVVVARRTCAANVALVGAGNRPCAGAAEVALVCAGFYLTRVLQTWQWMALEIYLARALLRGTSWRGKFNSHGSADVALVGARNILPTCVADVTVVDAGNLPNAVIVDVVAVVARELLSRNLFRPCT